MTEHIIAKWPAPKNVKACFSTRHGGQSQAPYESNNLALHVGDFEVDVIANRHRLQNTLLPDEPAWLNQTHSTDCVIIEEDSNRNADAAITRMKNKPLVILTADCLPIILCNIEGNEIAAIHAGWRGLLNGIVENTLHKMNSNPTELMAWIGPSICQNCYEVGPEVKEQFTHQYPFTHQAFKDRYADLPQMAESVLQSLGINMVYRANICTFEQKDVCYSYRRNQQTGRIGTFIWFQ